MSSGHGSQLSGQAAASSRGQPLVAYSFKGSVTCPDQLSYTLGKTIGSGTYAKVKAAWSPYERKMIAIKMLDKQRASREVLAKFLPREISVVRRLNHPSVLRVFRVVETPQELYFMMEMAENGDLLDYINWRGLLPESEARYVLRGVAAGVAHCHGRDIVHRDLKCENIMITGDMRVKIGDFGFSRLVGVGESLVTTPCGSYSYAAPELLSGVAGAVYDGKKVDIWSMGCVLYAMVCGALPFGDDTRVVKMVKQPLNFPTPITTECRHLLRTGMLNTDSEQRYDITELRLSPWMRGTACPLTPYPETRLQMDECLPQQSLPSWESINLHPTVVAESPQTPDHTTDGSARRPQPTSTPVSSTKKSKKEGRGNSSVKSKIGSASRKLVHSILHHHHRPSPSRATHPIETAV